MKIEEHTVRGNSTILECRYDLQGEVLYSVKWYKDGHEFYRYVPRDHPPAQLFPLPGVHVNVSLWALDLWPFGVSRNELSGLFFWENKLPRLKSSSFSDNCRVTRWGRIGHRQKRPIFQKNQVSVSSTGRVHLARQARLKGTQTSFRMSKTLLKYSRPFLLNVGLKSISSIVAVKL